MLPQLDEQNSSTSETEVQNFENHIDRALPGSYKRFLISSNGGRPRSPVFPISGLHSEDSDVINFFFGLGSSLEDHDLKFMFDWFKSRIPDGLIAFANNSGTDYLMFDMRVSPARVVFWDHAYFWSTGEWREQDLYHVANSFDEFLSLLRPNPH